MSTSQSEIILQNILTDIMEEIEATIDSPCINNLRIIERRRLVRCSISLRCQETFYDKGVQDSVVLDVPLEFTVNSTMTKVIMSIPREPTISGTYWFYGRRVQLREPIILRLNKQGKIIGSFEFELEHFMVEGIQHSCFISHFSISN